MRARRWPPCSGRPRNSGSPQDYVRRLLAAVNKTEDGTPASQGLTEPLSERELDVLRLLGTDLGGPEIARELIVSLNTVRTHTKNIYAKLGVNNRRAAVRRARELDLCREPATANPGGSSAAPQACTLAEPACAARRRDATAAASGDRPDHHINHHMW